MRDYLASYRAKVSRARLHLETLTSSIAAFAEDAEAYGVVKEALRDKGLYIFRLKLNREPPMTQWALMIGDCVHNARSALDHFFWSLVVRNNGGAEQPDAWDATFPITRTAEGFKKKKVHEMVGVEAAAILERLQPYHAPAQDSALGFLHNADIRDKHRLLIEKLAMIEQGRVEVVRSTVDVDHSIERKLVFQEDLHDGVVVATFVVDPPAAVADLNLVSMRLGLAVQRGPKAILAVPKALGQLIEEVEAIPGEFEGFF